MRRSISLLRYLRGLVDAVRVCCPALNAMGTRTSDSREPARAATPHRYRWVAEGIALPREYFPLPRLTQQEVCRLPDRFLACPIPAAGLPTIWVALPFPFE